MLLSDLIEERCNVSKKPDRFYKADVLDKVNDVFYSELPEKLLLFSVDRPQVVSGVFIVFHLINFLIFTINLL